MQPLLPEEALAPVMSFVRGYRGGFWIVGGWATDLHLGRATRQHHDVDVMFRADEQSLFEEQFGNAHIDLEHPISGSRRPWERTALTPGPDILVVAGAPCKVQFIPALFEGDAWIFPRGNHSIRRTTTLMSRRTAGGIPYQSPEVVLLYKSRQLRPQDEADLASVLPALEHHQLRWLRDSIQPSIPDHMWIPVLEAALIASPLRPG